MNSFLAAVIVLLLAKRTGAVIEADLDICVSAYAYCPGISKCFAKPDLKRRNALGLTSKLTSTVNSVLSVVSTKAPTKAPVSHPATSPDTNALLNVNAGLDISTNPDSNALLNVDAGLDLSTNPDSNALLNVDAGLDPSVSATDVLNLDAAATLGLSTDPSDWGWSIDVSDLKADGLLVCPIYIGALACDIESGERVGEVTITSQNVTFELESEIGGLEFNLYAGMCPANDAGMHLENGACDVQDEAMWFGTTADYSLVADFADSRKTLQKTFAFVGSTEAHYTVPNSLWAKHNYHTFPIGTDGNLFLSLHMNICPCGLNGMDCKLSVESPAQEVEPAKPSLPEQLDELCSTAYVFCPGISKCFGDFNPSNAKGSTNTLGLDINIDADLSVAGIDADVELNLALTSDPNMWGWGVDVSDLKADGVLVCPVYVGAVACDVEQGQIVGEVTITQLAVSLELETDLGGLEFHLYAGKCPANDAGLHLLDGQCNLQDEAAWFRTPKEYTLVADLDASLFSTFTVEANATVELTLPGSLWEELKYDPFPIGLGGHPFISLHTTVCPCGSNGMQCPLPMAAPTPTSVALPSRQPTMTLMDTAVPSPIPTSDLTSMPTCEQARLGMSPTGSPSLLSGRVPSSSSIAEQVEPPTYLSPDFGTQNNAEFCSTAFAYCPGVSKCFGAVESSKQTRAKLGLDIDADLGVTVLASDGLLDIDANVSLGLSLDPKQWGWSIDVGGLEENESLVCPVYVGANQCDIERATQIGEITILPLSVSIELESDFGGLGFYLYAGSCAANDGGMHLATGECSLENEITWFNTPTEYSLVADFEASLHNTFSFEANATLNLTLPSTLWEEYNYHAFPIGSEGHKFISLRATVCPCGINGRKCVTSNPSPADSESTSSTPKSNNVLDLYASVDAALLNKDVDIDANVTLAHSKDELTAKADAETSVLGVAAELDSDVNVGLPYDTENSDVTASVSTDLSVLGSNASINLNVSLGLPSPTGHHDVAPTSSDSSSKPASLDFCSTAYAYCPGISKCFGGIESTKPKTSILGLNLDANLDLSVLDLDASLEAKVGLGLATDPKDWGWSIDVSSLTEKDSLVCPIYVGALECDIEKGQIIGEATITSTSVSVAFQSNFGGIGFHLYAGKCPANDAGEHLLTGKCSIDDQATWFDTTNKYSVTADFDASLQSIFSLEANATVDLKTPTTWKKLNYDSFPIGSGGHPFISLHSSVCPCGVNGLACFDSSKTDSTVPTTLASSERKDRWPSSDLEALPTLSPIVSPVMVPNLPPCSPSELPSAPEAPTPAPSSSPTPKPSAHAPTAKPTSGPTHLPTSSPTHKPSTSSPTATPTSRPTPVPTFKPTLRATKAPTETPTGAPTEDVGNKDCETAYLFCPGISTCFAPDIVQGRWGWYNDLAMADGEDYLECPIYAGAAGCDIENKGTIVGYAEITTDYVIFQFSPGKGAAAVHMYSGQCVVNDNGEHLKSGECEPENYSPLNNGGYPIVADSFNEKQMAFFISSDESEMYMKKNSIWSEESYSAFPLGVGEHSLGNRYLTLHTSVCDCPECLGFRK